MKIVLVGAGRIAWHLGRRLKSKGFPIAQVLNRSEESAHALAATLGCPWSNQYAEALPDADWVLIAVRDDAIAAVAETLSRYVPGALVAHTSGATPGAVLAPYFERYGVFYPLQSFSKERSPTWSKIPFCLHANNEPDLALLRKVAKIVGNLVYTVNDAQRAQLHLAAVFANNFANHCFALAEHLLETQSLPFEMLHPLMEETLQKALADSPARMQTGPAARGDVDTMQRHLALLAPYPSLQTLYETLSKNIQQFKMDN